MRGEPLIIESKWEAQVVSREEHRRARGEEPGKAPRSGKSISIGKNALIAEVKFAEHFANESLGDWVGRSDADAVLGVEECCPLSQGVTWGENLAKL